MLVVLDSHQHIVMLYAMNYLNMLEIILPKIRHGHPSIGRGDLAAKPSRYLFTCPIAPAHGR